MKAGKVIGSVVGARVVPGLERRRFLVVVPVGESGAIEGEPFVACDVVNAGAGASVIWVGAREASLALGEPDVPVDATCVAILERHTLS